MQVNILKAVLLKLASAMLFAIMSALVRYVSDVTPLGQMVFFRSAFGIIPVVVIYAWRRELMTAVRTSRPFGHLGRGADQRVRHVLQFRRACAAADRGRDDHHVRLAADYGRARRRSS